MEMLELAAELKGCREQIAAYEVERAQMQQYYRRAIADRDDAKAAISRLREYVRDCATNWDCDEDAHTYGTTCRKCDAEALLSAMAGGA